MLYGYEQITNQVLVWGVKRQAGKEGMHCARITKRVLSVSETSTVTEAMNVLARG